MTDQSGSTGPHRTRLTADAPVPIGRQSEPQVVRIVSGLLTASDHAVAHLPSRDDRGEDACLSIDGRPYTVQITGVPHAPEFWRRVAVNGSATTSATLQEMSKWLYDAIESKLVTIPESERRNTIIAVNAHGWADQIVDPDVVSRLSSSGLNPAKVLGLGGIAITGAGTSNSTWLPGGIR